VDAGTDVRIGVIVHQDDRPIFTSERVVTVLIVRTNERVPEAFSDGYALRWGQVGHTKTQEFLM